MKKVAREIEVEVKATDFAAAMKQQGVREEEPEKAINVFLAKQKILFIQVVFCKIDKGKNIICFRFVPPSLQLHDREDWTTHVVKNFNYNMQRVAGLLNPQKYESLDQIMVD